ncbi:MAG: response regulator [Dehalococcoidales bacterium]|nr:response regulator [Dehalococcoidales bacterium]
MDDNAPLVMVVDDEPTLCSILQRILQKDGYRVITACDGMTALELVKQTKPDLVVLDIMLPGMDGRELSSRIRENTDCRIIYFTARADLLMAENVKELSREADAFITKPASIKRILSVVGSTLGVNSGLELGVAGKIP